ILVYIHFPIIINLISNPLIISKSTTKVYIQDVDLSLFFKDDNTKKYKTAGIIPKRAFHTKPGTIKTNENNIPNEITPNIA
ncbi:hypothetical protein, partial [Bacillus paramycoides]|uniref:hypothetical protein n=1 Tax=Bacillus paramycoides TaxID=2026194 RepID=UPI003D2084AA